MSFEKLVAFCVASLSTASIILWLTQKKRRLTQNPATPTQKWKQIGHVRELLLYPLKSGAAVELDEVDCDEFGIYIDGMRDRMLMLCMETDNKKIAGAGIYPKMLSIKTQKINEESVCLTAPSMEPLQLNISEISKTGKKLMKKMKGFRLPLVECEAAQSRWCSRAVLNQEQGLCLYIVDQPIKDKIWWHPIESGFNPIMVLHDKSVEDLNERLLPGDKVQHQQFRGNVLIASDTHIRAFDEDNWFWLRIGDETILRYQAPCVRCILPNIELQTFQRNKNFEPLKTLKKYRLRSDPKEPEMGVFFEVYKSGAIRKGDKVFVQYKNTQNDS